MEANHLILIKFVKKSLLKNYFIQYKPFLSFLGKFFLTYIVLTLLYNWYLSQFNEALFEIDGFTLFVSNQVEKVLLLFNLDTSSTVLSTEPSIRIFYNHKSTIRIVEGCNALSVVILFIAFVVSFAGRAKQTLLFILVGSVFIHVLNVIRIALLAVLLYHFKAQETFLHDLFFPLIIYGFVFLLWVIWVNTFSLYAKKNTK